MYITFCGERFNLWSGSGRLIRLKRMLRSSSLCLASGCSVAAQIIRGINSFAREKKIYKHHLKSEMQCYLSLG
jgi:hypothetical protein